MGINKAWSNPFGSTVNLEHVAYQAFCIDRVGLCHSRDTVLLYKNVNSTSLRCVRGCILRGKGSKQTVA